MPDSVYLYANDIGAAICDDTHESTAIDCFKHSYNVSVSIAEYLLRKRHINYITKLDHVKANGRCMMLKDDRKNESYVFVDVAHNPASVKHMFDLIKLKHLGVDVQYEAVFGLLKGKDISKILTIAKPYIKKWNIVDLSFIDSRAADISQIHAEFVRHNISIVDFHESLDSVYLSKKSTLTVVFGSFVLAGEFIKNYAKNSK
jgi:dihydrofolate synthase/folylpolyglutamate synthase